MALKNRISNFERDFVSVAISFPKLTHFWNSSNKLWIVRGELDICDVKGDYWNTFDIAILVPENYPYCVPQVVEMSQLIPREQDWHVSKEGACCLDLDNKLIASSKSGINLEKFIQEKVYPFFANQLFKLEEKKYAGEEYGHHVDGLIQYYTEDLRFPSAAATTEILKKILNHTDLTRNKFCPCGSNMKIKKCHEKEFDIIKSLGREKISQDLKMLEKFLICERTI